MALIFLLHGVFFFSVNLYRVYLEEIISKNTQIKSDIS